MTRWINPAPVEVPASFADLNLSPLIAQTLIRRGIDTLEVARAFLHPDSLPSTPFPNIEPAVKRIEAAIRAKEMICVWGDFDVDGQSSTTLLVQTLQALGANVVYYIPIRGKESHGVHIGTLKPILDNGAKLLLTCDTGITAYEAIDYANSRGVDVVVTDHHELGATLPNAKAVINPKLLPEDHILANLAGVGVAYKLAEALIRSSDLSRGSGTTQVATTDLLDLVALGLIADVALLKGETRSLAQRGIQVLRNTGRIGLRVMAELSGTSLESLTEESIGFSFAPRLNALGRLSDANPAVELLLSHDPTRVRVIAAQIEGLNAQRRLLTNQVYEAAEAQLREHPELLSEPVIILTNQNWPGGVVGIVANKLVERYRKPAILLNQSENGILRGSARSVEGLHITEAITTQKDLLLGFGGHPMAAGLALAADKLAEFRRGLGKAIERQLGTVVSEEPVLQVDAWLGLDEINLELAESLEALAPFGAGNPPLTLATHQVSLRSVAGLGRAKEHLRLNVEDENGNVQSFLWWGGAGGELPEEGSKFDIAYSMRASTFRGEKQVTLQFEAFRIVAEAPPELKKHKLEIIDYRLESASLLATLQEQAPGLQIWAEGVDKAKGKSRFELHPADEFAIYTTPPSPNELQAALETVKPKRVYLFGVSPAAEKPDSFLARMAGLAKYAINQKSGKVTVGELAVVTGQRAGAIRLGLEWLAAGGHISIQSDVSQDTLLLSTGNGELDQYLQRELYIAVKGILEETAAYRAHFQRAEAERLIELK
ncbi:MAG TPA: single-stranded-DNA-specific exonuclease RecJ [Anaerolineales bacterium]|nr:single-stranded-DNA-specific exonuclease RecJ [Anaerolineales bacterium]HLO33553.1 single-stranded-DNA-specific exonuclease RecJ [Anaerolineales bacterium]